MVACIHDEIILEARTELSQETAEMLVRLITTAGKKFLRRVHATLDTTVHNHWG